MTLRDRLARFLCEEHQLRWKDNVFWNDLSMAQKDTWRNDADRYIAHLEERGLRLSQD